ncbi:uncharacterized protein F4812DRAFT_429186 [Daldinia caldariorum]|uniref:uncharacterized protein n=1 Tax=Daldinia caldariorum TaxID=326644 RepID=UPI0020078D40|nr:uncharacterized protein F4812DRAFT_429186 [Daldinia caldariorum]KAI1467339.1 hypothetical protein F4812DRAFT_429186 [Daldinia caldariorum]
MSRHPRCSHRRFRTPHSRVSRQQQALLGVGAQFGCRKLDYTEVAFALDELRSSPLDISQLLRAVLDRSLATGDFRMILLESNIVASLSLRSTRERNIKAHRLRLMLNLTY